MKLLGFGGKEYLIDPRAPQPTLTPEQRDMLEWLRGQLVGGGWELRIVLWFPTELLLFWVGPGKTHLEMRLPVYYTGDPECVLDFRPAGIAPPPSRWVWDGKTAKALGVIGKLVNALEQEQGDKGDAEP